VYREMEWNMRKVSSVFSKHLALSEKEFVYAVILTFVFAFAILIGYVRSEPHPQYPKEWILVHFGFPFEWLTLTTNVSAILSQHTQVSFVALVLDFIVYFLVAFVIVLGFKKLAEYIRA